MLTGADVIAFRERRHLSRRALATECGLTEGKIWRIENKNTFKDDELAKLMLLGVTPIGATIVDDAVIIQVPQPSPSAITAPYVAPTPQGSVPIITERPVVPAPEPVIEIDLAELSSIAQRRFEHYVSNSELQTFKRCRRKWWLAWYRGLHLRHESPVGVRQVGDRLHRALKEHYTPAGPAYPEHVLEVLERLILEDRQSLRDVDVEVFKKFEDEANLERIMLEGYLAWLAETGADSELKIIAPETYLEAELIEFGSERVAIIGKLDVRVQRTTDGVHLFIDHKSVGDLRTPTLTLPLDEQMLHYHLLEQLNLTESGQRSDGALYNMLRRVKRTVRAQPPFYQRVEVRHNTHELESYQRRVIGEIQDILDLRESLDRGSNPQAVAYPRPTRDCTWDCPFFAVCPMFDDGSRAEAMVERYYEQRDPLSYYMAEMIGVTE